VDIGKCTQHLDEGAISQSILREEAWKLSVDLFKDKDKRNRFADEVADLYIRTRDADFILIYNTGGFGAGTMKDDPEWPGILEGIKEELAQLDYRAVIIEHNREEGGFLKGFIGELKDLRHNYYQKARELAAKISFITTFNPKLTVISTGRCFGGIVCNEVMKINREDSHLYSIQASIPFWYTEPVGQRSMVISDNGIMPDIVTKGGVIRFLWTLFRANWRRLPSVDPSKEGSFRAVCRYLKAPGHTYTWDHPNVRFQVTSFLKKNFYR